jgi:hypothetical protein
MNALTTPLAGSPRRVARQPGKASYDRRKVREAIRGIHVLKNEQGDSWKVLTMAVPRITQEFSSEQAAKDFAQSLKESTKRRVFDHTKLS